MSIETTCCFTGHRALSRDFSVDTLKRGIFYLVNQGIDTFICGGAKGFDTVCALEVLEAKKFFPQIKLHIYAPCNNQTDGWKLRDKMTYNKILRKADYVDMPNTPYFEGCMRERNYKMVDNSSTCLCYMNNTRSGTGHTFRYAQKKGLTIYNIAGK